MNTEQAAALEQKRQGFQQQLEQWVREESVLKPGEQLVCEVKLAVQSIPRVIVQTTYQVAGVFSHNGRVFYEKRPLSPDELKQIISLPWTGWRSQVVSQVIARGNEGIQPEKIIEVTEGSHDIRFDRAAINLFLQKHDLPYRLIKDENSDHSQKYTDPYRFYCLSR